MTLAAPTVYTDLLNTTSGRTLTWGAFAAAIGDLLVVKAQTEDSAASHQLIAPTADSGGVTFAKQVECTTANHTYGSIYTGVITTAPTGGQITITQAPNGTSTLRGGIVSQYVAAKVAATPAIVNTTGTGAPAGTLTTVANGSIIEGMAGDWSAKDGATRAYLSSATEEGYEFNGTLATLYWWRQAATTAGSQSVGLSAPVTPTAWALLGIEIQDNAPAANPIPEVVMAPIRRY